MQPVKNMTFNMELYSTLPNNNPSRQAFYTVSQNQQVFVEVWSAIQYIIFHVSLVFFNLPELKL